MDFDPTSVDLTDEDAQRRAACYFEASERDDNGPVQVGMRIGLLFVILVVSTFFTVLPIWANRRYQVKKSPDGGTSQKRRFRLYLAARYIGAGVIIATAFIHLLDPAYDEIGPDTCVGLTGHWADFSWPPAIMLTATMLVFLVDLLSQILVEQSARRRNEAMLSGNDDLFTLQWSLARRHQSSLPSTSAPQQGPRHPQLRTDNAVRMEEGRTLVGVNDQVTDQNELFKQQFAAFLVLETSIIFHSVIIGLTLGASSSGEFPKLCTVIIFHQSFEGLGLGARMSAIPFPDSLEKIHLPWGLRLHFPYVLCVLYGLTTPVAFAGGLGARHWYDDSSPTANKISGVLNAISAGILLYTGLVEVLAKDFIFDPYRSGSRMRLSLMVIYVLFGAGIMAALGKWA